MTSAFQYAADLLDPPVDIKWVPLPHQIPPAGHWFAWLLLGGRGAGKTAAAAKYMHDHVMGPPCLPDVPGGHHPGIIAPTLGDGVTSCVNGPSGLRTHCPEIKLRNTIGGTVVRWPNGTEAKLFGAHSPEDVERLRSGGNRCFVWCLSEGQRVLTDHGWLPIETIVPGKHKAWTDEGWMPIADMAMTNPEAIVLAFTLSNGRTLRCTGDHRIFMADGRTCNARDLTPGDIMASCSTHALTEEESLSEKTSSSMVSSSNSALVDTIDAEEKSSIGMSMKRNTVHNRDLTSTTKTKTRQTTGPVISRHSQRNNTQEFIVVERTTSSLLKEHASTAERNGWLKQQQLQGGEERQRDSAAHCVVIEGQRHWVNSGARSAIHASSATHPLPIKNTAQPNATTTLANQTTELVRLAGNHSRGNAKDSAVTNVKAQEHVQPSHARNAESQCEETRCVTVVSIATELNKTPVYDISVPGPQHFYAEGVKVHNCEELAAWRYMQEAWQHMRYGLRIGPWPHCVISTTPKALTLIKALVKEGLEHELDEDGNPTIVITKASTDANPHLDKRVKRDLYADYGSSRLGRQELHAEILADVVGALWTPGSIEENRFIDFDEPPRFNRIVVSIDPPSKDIKDGGAEAGIVVVGRTQTFHRDGIRSGEYPHAFVLGDYSLGGRPEDWGDAAVAAYHDHEADIMIGEVNNGGDMVGFVIRSIDDTIPFKSVHASRGKDRRAEPISNLYQQGRFHHMGVFTELEDQMTGWDALDPDPAWSPDRMDALVWGGWELMIGKNHVRTHTPQDRRLRHRR